MSKSPTFKTLSVLNLIEKIVEKTKNIGSASVPQNAKSYVTELSKRLDINEKQALMLSVLVDQSDDNRIRPRDIAHHFDCRTISILANNDSIEELVKRSVIVRRNAGDGDVTYRVPPTTLEALQKGSLPTSDAIANLSAQNWIDAVDKYLDMREEDEMTDEDLYSSLHELIDENQHLEMARKLKSFGLNDSNLVLYLAISLCFINNNDDRVCKRDIEDYFTKADARRHAAFLEIGAHILINANLVEHSCIDGQVKSDEWRLTNYSKAEVFSELNLVRKVDVKADLTRHEDIVQKKLYFPSSVQKQVSQLESLLDEDRMRRILDKLSEKGLRKGFACLFYGSPGTGKTETVMQLAKRSGRDLMIVDIPSIRDKWVGETEKHIKAVFDRYRKVAASNEKAPILVFNEADAILNRRNEASTTGVDKMENAMQNIILQEMENLEGIMIATTNLTSNLDPAFERRFLYKIEFEKPTYKERKNIWTSMISDLSEKDAESLAKDFEFSGGQIENIARKRVISDILDDRDSVDVEAIREACRSELISKSSSAKKIGY